VLEHLYYNRDNIFLYYSRAAPLHVPHSMLVMSSGVPSVSANPGFLFHRDCAVTSP
jgi:hypothetical protein